MLSFCYGFGKLVSQPVTEPDIKKAKPSNNGAERQPDPVLRGIDIFDGQRYEEQTNGNAAAANEKRGKNIFDNIDATAVPPVNIVFENPDWYCDVIGHYQKTNAFVMGKVNRLFRPWFDPQIISPPWLAPCKAKIK